MTATFGSSELDRFRAAISGCLGLQFEDAKLGFLAEVFHRRLESTRQNPDMYLARLGTNVLKDEISALAQELTVPETYFFRHIDQYRAFAEIAVPDCIGPQRAVKRVRIVSAGCASGEEPYSLAMLVREAAVDRSCDVSILGIDINPAMLRKAARGRFSAWALREAPADIRQKWFRQEGSEFALDDGLRTSVRFEERNLVQHDPEFWRPGSCDIIFCRNVLMYFTPEQGRAAVARLGRALRAGGYLFLGHAETLRGLSSDFHLCHTHDTFYYQRKDSFESVPRPWPAAAAADTWAPVLLATVVDSSPTWIEAIREAADRIKKLTDSPVPQRPSVPPAPATPAWDLGLALDRLREERFGDALEIVQGLPPESRRDPDVLLLQAALLTQSGQLAKAEEACRGLLDVDELNAGAHYLLALCREGANDRPGACYHDQVAIYLDPGFAMPHLHLGLLARRASELAVAQRELGQAIVLLRGEDGSRVLLFGGGFGRDALVALCRTELLACGGKPETRLT